MRTPKLIATLLLLLLVPYRNAAATLEFRSLSVNDGLSQSTVLAVAQDPSGHIWMGTQDGLNRYDGYTFTIFRHDEENPHSLNDNYINALHADGGHIWIGTSQGLSVYDAQTEQFENYQLEGHPMQIFDITDETDNRLLLATDIGVVRFEKESRKLELKHFTQGIIARAFCPCRDGFLIGTSQGLYLWSSNYGHAEQVVPALAHFDIAGLVADDHGFWVATYGNGLYRLDLNLRLVKHYEARDYPGLASDYIRVLKLDADGRLWIGTFDGLSIYDPESATFESHAHTSAPGALSHNSIRAIFIDAQQGVWLGTYYGGVDYWHPLAKQFEIIRNIPSSNSLGDNTVCCITEIENGLLWIGTNDDGLNLYDRATGRFSEYNTGNNTLKSNNVKCLLPDGKGALWIGTHAGGLTRMDCATRRVTHYPINADIPINNSCYALLQDHPEQLRVGTLNGLLSFDIQTGTFAPHPVVTTEPRLSKAPVFALLRDTQHQIWIGTTIGLFRQNTTDNTVEEVDLRTDPREGENKHAVVMCLAESASHEIWIGTRQGLYRYTPNNGRIRRYTTADGLPNNCINSILEDDLGRLWIATNSGLTCFDVPRDLWRTYTMRDGLANNQFNPQACHKGLDGSFYFGGIGGLTYFHPHRLVDNPFTPEAQVVGIDVADADQKVKIERDSIGRIRSAEIPSACNFFAVHFVTINPLSGGHNTYEYQLEGVNTHWHQTTTRQVSYSNLRPGHYTFRVRVANSNGAWSEQITEVPVDILPMWWQTTAARLAEILLALVAIGALIYAITGRLKMKVLLQLERREREQTEELSQEKIRFYINLSHELRTPLTLIMSPLQEIREHGHTDKYVASRLGYVYRYSLKLMHIINQMLDYRKAELGMFRMRIARQDVDGIVAEVFSLFEESAQKRDMDYLLCSDLKGEQLPVDRMFVEMMLTNLLSNAFKYTPDGGSIRLSVSRIEGNLRLAVHNTGSGLTLEEQKHLFDHHPSGEGNPTNGGGLGLHIVRRIVALHQGTFSIKSEPGAYCEFIIDLPDRLEVYPEEKRARKDDVRGSIIRDAEPFLPDEWSGGDIAEFTPQEEPVEQRMTLLLVEADREVAHYIAEHFKRQYDIRTLEDGNEVLEQIKTIEPDLLIVDRTLPGMDGLKLCRSVKQNIRTCHIPVILLAPDGGVEEQITGIEAGADAYLPMPLSVSLLYAKVQSLLKARDRMRHKYSDDPEIDPDKITSNSMDGEFLKRAIAIVEENLDNEEFSSNDFSKALCMSRSNLHLKMKSITGDSTTQFIRKIRFNRACRLLSERKHSIAEISAMVGFNSPSYFATSFKKYMGCLPTEYVKNRNKNDESE